MVAVTLTATYATAGTFVWTCPPGVTSVTVACTGAGGGGGASGAAAGSNGGGGGGGEAAAEASVPVTPNLDYTVTAGAGGAAGTQGGAGAAGGDTSFTGDAGLVVAAHGGTGGTSGNATGAGQGGLGGDGSVNSVSAAGGNADDGTPATNGGAGGGAAGVSTTTGFPGNPGAGSVAGAASGGTWPGGAGGAGSTSGGAPAPSGSAPGGGGGGALSTGTNRAGGAGGAGQVVITWAQNDPVTLTGGTDGAVCTFTAPSGAATVKAECWGGGASGFNPATSGNAGVSGASVFTGIYGGTRQQAADTFDGYVGRTPALAAQVVYLDESVWPTDGDHPQAVQTLTNMGCKVFVCFKPSRQAVLTGGATLTTEKANLAAACALYSAIPGVSWYAALWNECNAFGQHGPFGDGTQKGGPSPYGTPTAAQAAANYLAYCAAYAPTIAAAGIEVAYKPALFSDTTTLTFFPGYGGANGGCDLVIADWYGTDWIKNSIDLFGAANLEGLADAGGLPLGLGEWGASAGTAPSVADYNAFTAHFMAGWQARITAGKPIGDIIYYGGKTAGGPNVITGPADYKVSSIQQITDLLAGSTGAHGGAGGGGGEYAAESALVITGGRNYTLVVGSGGTGSASGKTTTAAGDAVTVTAHGGSVAALTTAGGAGGTGSPNTTHHPGGAGGAGATLPGGGGGGSGGTGATGNAGAAPVGFSGGLGGAAVTAGGPGGAGGVNGGNGSPPPIGPGGGGGARGANGATNGSGSDGQITLSNFAVGVGCAGGLALAPLHLAGTCTAPAGAFSLAPLHVAGTGNVCDFTQVQVGPTVGPSTTTVVPTLATPSLPGSMLKAVLQIGTTTATTAPAGWVMAASQNAGGGSGRAEVWYYPSNPGGISGASFTGGAGDTLRAFLSEYSTPAGTTQAADVTGVASGAAPSTSFPVSTAAPNTGGDLGTVVFVDKFSVGTAGTWTTPASWSPERQNTGGAAWFASYTQCGLTAATQAATGTVSVSTNQTGWAAVLATFKTVTLAAGTGAVALAPLAFSGTGTSAVSAGTVAASGALALSPIGFISPSLASTFPADPLPAMVEILINGTWTDITSFVYARDGITISSRGRPDEASTTQPAQATITLNNREGTFSPQNTSGQFYPWLVRNVQLRISVVNATTTQGAWYTGYRFWGEVPAWPPQWNTAGTDVYVQVTAAGVLQRMRQSKFSASPLARYYGNIISGAAQNPGSGLSALIPAGYWPCEDGSSSATFSSGIPGGSPMTWTGTPGLAADSNVAGSAPFAQLNSSAWTGTPGAFSSGGITFATPGTYSWTCPGGVTSVQAECWGGGGGGSNGFFGPGGGGSEYAAEPALAVTPGKAYVVVVGSGGAGGAGSFSPAGGSSGQATSFTGDAVTVTANGGKGAPRNSSGGNGAGGSGSGNAVHHNGGHGASWGNANGGSGGGGSGGSSSTGNNGHSNSGLSGGAGGSAVTGGGPGGKGGDGGLTAGPTATAGMAPSPGPGGGGGGGGFNGANQYGKPGGNGFAGQVRLTFGTSVIPNANVLRVVVDVPSTGGTNNANLAQASTSGTVATLNLIYHTGGNLELQGKNAGGSQLFTSGSKSFGANGQPLLVSCELTQSLTSVKWKLTAIKPGATAVVATYSGTQNSATLGAVTQVNVNNATTDTTATGVGHLAVQYAVDPVLNLAGAFAAYVGETAGARFLRLCEEQQVPAAILGNITDTPQMGAQPTGLLVDLLQDCENADLGLMFERRDTFGLGYRTRVSLQNQAPSVVLDYAAGQLSPPFTPTNDDQLTRNDVVATRANGGTSYEAIQATGPLSVQDPPNGAGLYGYQVTPNLFADTQLAAFAQWLLVLGTLDEFRYPVLTVNMVSPNMASGVFSAMASLDAGDFLTIVNPPAWLPPMPINQLAFGFTETLNMFEWTIAVNAVPADPYTSNDVLPTW